MSGARSREFDVLIVGAGVIGLSAASVLLARKVCSVGRVAVIADRFGAPPAADADWDLRVFAMSRASERLLKICGVWDALPAMRVFPYERMCVWDAGGSATGSGALKFDCAQIGEPNLGYIVDAKALAWQCLQAARASGVVLIEGGVAAVVPGDDEVRLRLDDGRELRAGLLAAADGTDSKTRDLLGIDTAGHAYHQDALVAHVRTAVPHGNTAWQRFLNTGPVAFLPLSDGRCSIVWSIARSQAERLLAMDPEAFGEALTAASGEALGKCTLSSKRAAFPLKLQYAVDYARPRAVLLGDAAHVVHPLAGQGLNLGLLDCAALAEVLGAAGGADYFGDMKFLRRYERWRRGENLLAAAALDGLERLFSHSDALSAGLRTAGLSAVARMPFLKRGFAQRALGLTGDVPEFLKAV
ncbi:MAG TPA: UbiH/UbiF/VisC/COQ6 family ubiquinone biosynthesis hydroxylase [Steroidobacteraceae bacterium]|jgi:2-octaprenylphenol hydroxylase|nr:UbiH/UbiF/VisC/COQ6 family ubiquinone biosynthesis hydroxylase [Steroidobacteraceae bacterium]